MRAKHLFQTIVLIRRFLCQKLPESCYLLVFSKLGIFRNARLTKIEYFEQLLRDVMNIYIVLYMHCMYIVIVAM